MSTSTAAGKPNSERNAKIVDLRKQGLTLQEIADQTDLTRERVRQIIKRAGGVTAVDSWIRRRDEQARAELEFRVRETIAANPGATAVDLAALVGIDVRELHKLSSPEARRLLIENEDRNSERNAKIVDLRKQGLTLQEIADQTDLTRERVRQIIKRAGGVTAVDSRTSTRWSDESMLEVLRIASTYDFPLKTAAYARLVSVGEVKGPSIALFYRRFGSWRAACDLAGVETFESRRPTYQSTWTDIDLLSYFADFLANTAYSSSFNGYRDWRTEVCPEAPATGTMLNRFGSWNALKRRVLQDSSNPL